MEDRYLRWSAWLDRYAWCGGPDPDAQRRAANRRRVAQYRRLAARGVRTLDDLTRRWDRLHPRTRQVAVELLGFTGDRRAVPFLARVFDRHAALRWPAALSIACLAGRRAQTFARSRTRALLATPVVDPDLARPVIHALCRLDDSSWNLFLEILNRRDLPTLARAEVMEHVGLSFMHHGSERRHRPRAWKRCRAAAIETLRDEEAEMRFWAVYAAGQMRLVETSPLLRRMAKRDHASAQWMWTIAEEAQDVLTYWRTGDWPDRIPPRTAT